jgi:hypothetical protein
MESVPLYISRNTLPSKGDSNTIVIVEGSVQSLEKREITLESLKLKDASGNWITIGQLTGGG